MADRDPRGMAHIDNGQPIVFAEPQRTPPDDTTTGLRERLIAVIKSIRIHPELDGAVTAMITAGAGFHVTDDEAGPLADAVIGALSGLFDPGDLPARMAWEIRNTECEHFGRDGEACSRCRATAALAVRWETAVQQAAENAELRRKLEHAEGELSARIEQHQRAVTRWITAGAETGRLRSELAETREKLAELRDLQVGIKRLTTETGAVEMSLHMAHDMMRACVAGFVKILNAEDAPNYVELAYSLRNDPERYTVTIQRPRGKTPAEVASEAKQQARQAEAALAQLRAYAAWCKDRDVEPDERDIRALADGTHTEDYVALMNRDAE